MRADRRLGDQRPVGHGGDQQPGQDGEDGDGEAEDQGDADGFQVEWIGKNVDEIIEPDEPAALAERVAEHHRLEQALGGRPVKKRQRHQDLGRDQQVGQESGCEMGSLDHRNLEME